MFQCNEGGYESQPDIAPATPAPKINILSVQIPRQKSVNIREEDEKRYDDGYNIDVEQFPLFDLINIEGEQYFDEDEFLKEVTDCSDIPTDSEDSTSKPPRHEDIPPDSLSKLKVSYFKEELKKHGQSTVGLSKVLLERVKLSLKNKVPLATITANKNQVGNKMNGFAIHAYWEFLKPNSSTVEEPINSPTIQEADISYFPVKYDFHHIFDRDEF